MTAPDLILGVVVSLDVERRQVDFITSYLTQTNSLGVVTGQPAPVTSAVGGITSAVGSIIPSLFLPSVSSQPVDMTSMTSTVYSRTSTAAPGFQHSTTLSSTKSSSQTTGTSAGHTSTGLPPVLGSDGLSTGSKAAIGAIVPIVFIALLAIIFFLLRRRKQSKASNWHPGTEVTDQPIPDLIVVENKSNRDIALEKPELPGSTVAALPTYQSSTGNAAEAHASHTYSQAHYQYPTPQQLHADETPNAKGPEIPPASSADLSDNDWGSRPHELHTPNDWTQRHELGTQSRTASVYSDGQTLKSAGDQGDKDMYLEKLEAKRTAVNEERERLRRMEMLREEDERLEREIDEYKKTRGL
ncbi:uncharacterized protein AALT_g7920 [Alternaria alternata]|nr:uncharacterized protein AALT_g7920 [Alternaria alternata]